MRRMVPWLIVAVVTLGITALTTVQALERYRDLRTGWSWDLAYYNQWFWALTKGDGMITVRPLAAYATDGPSVWKMNYLAPVRFVCALFYSAWPDPRALLVFQNVMFWWIIPAAFTLVRSESKSDWLGVLAAVLVPMTPLAWPLVWNDFRELQLGVPFVLWALQGWRSRNLRVTALGIAGMLACRQEFAVIVATFPVVPAREREDIGRTYVWNWSALMLGMAWVFLAFFGYLEWKVGYEAAEAYMAQFDGPNAPLGETLETAFDFLWVGMGSWLILSLAAPRVALIAMPWVWSLSHGRWALRLIGTSEWHHVRYASPMFALMLAAGLIGFATIGRRLLGRARGKVLVGVVWGMAALGMIAPNLVLQQRFAAIPELFTPEETVAIRRWIGEVRPDEGVLAHYDVTAPLSSRAILYSYVLDPNKPIGYPQLEPKITWVFLRGDALPPEVLKSQGFKLVHGGPDMRIYRRQPQHSG